MRMDLEERRRALRTLHDSWLEEHLETALPSLQTAWSHCSIVWREKQHAAEKTSPQGVWS